MTEMILTPLPRARLQTIFRSHLKHLLISIHHLFIYLRRTYLLESAGEERRLLFNNRLESIVVNHEVLVLTGHRIVEREKRY